MTQDIKEGILIGIKSRNKKKLYCKRGHILPARVNGKRNCMVCADIRRSNYTEQLAKIQRKANENRRKIRDSSFPMVERLKIGGILN